MVCQNGWLSTMLSKMDNRIKAVGVRLDKAKVPEGTLHILGCIIGFQIFKKLKLSFLPRLPDYDTGDLDISGLRKSGYDIFAFPNTLHNASLIQLIPDNSPLKRLHVDRSFGGNNQIFFCILVEELLNPKRREILKEKLYHKNGSNLGKNIFCLS